MCPKTFVGSWTCGTGCVSSTDNRSSPPPKPSSAFWKCRTQPSEPPSKTFHNRFRPSRSSASAPCPPCSSRFSRNCPAPSTSISSTTIHAMNIGRTNGPNGRHRISKRLNRRILTVSSTTRFSAISACKAVNFSKPYWIWTRKIFLSNTTVHGTARRRP